MGIDERMAVVSEGIEERVGLGPEKCGEPDTWVAEPAVEGDNPGVAFGAVALALAGASAFGPAGFPETVADPAVEPLAPALADFAGAAGRFADSGRGGFAEAETPFPASSRIRSTIAGSRLARTLGFTSRFHFWIRSTSSGPFNPSSLANSWTRVDNGDSS